MGTKRILNDLSLNDKVSFKDSSYGVGVVLGYNKDIGKHLIGYNSSGKKHSGAFTNTGGHFVQNKDNKYVYSDKLKEFQHYYYADSTLELLNTEEGNEGYRLGDEVEVQFQANGTVCTKGAYWDGSTTRKAQVVGFTDTGDALLYMTSSDGPAYGMGFSPDINRLIDSKYDGKLDTSRSAFVNSGSISMSKTGKKQTIRKDTVNVMSSAKEGQSFMDLMKSDMGTLPIGSPRSRWFQRHQGSHLGHDEESRSGITTDFEALSEMLDTEIGESAIAFDARASPSNMHRASAVILVRNVSRMSSELAVWHKLETWSLVSPPIRFFPS